MIPPVSDRERRAANSKVVMNVVANLGGSTFRGRVIPGGLMIFDPPLLAELRAWRLLGAELMPHIERLLAAQGDRADRDLVRLQHTLAELLAPAPVISREPSSSIPS
jgi:hypothetical protein